MDANNSFCSLPFSHRLSEYFVMIKVVAKLAPQGDTAIDFVQCEFGKYTTNEQENIAWVQGEHWELLHQIEFQPCENTPLWPDSNCMASGICWCKDWLSTETNRAFSIHKTFVSHHFKSIENGLNLCLWFRLIFLYFPLDFFYVELH